VFVATASVILLFPVILFWDEFSRPWPSLKDRFIRWCRDVNTATRIAIKGRRAGWSSEKIDQEISRALGRPKDRW